MEKAALDYNLGPEHETDFNQGKGLLFARSLTWSEQGEPSRPAARGVCCCAEVLPVGFCFLRCFLLFLLFLFFFVFCFFVLFCFLLFAGGVKSGTKPKRLL